MPHSILVIDDEEDIREVARVSLELVGGWDVLTADSGDEGIRVAASSQPSVILLDLMMPDMDGAATLHELRAHPDTRAIPVIFLTAKVQPTESERLGHLGAAGVLAKPFDPMTLSSQIEAVLNGQA